MSKTPREKSRSNDCLYESLERQMVEEVSTSDRNVIEQSNNSKWIFVISLGLFVTGVTLLSLILYGALFNRLHTIVIFPMFATNTRFISLGLDSSVIADGFKNFDMKSTKLKNMLRNLSPGYLRVGGTLADRLEFVVNDDRDVKFNYINVQDGDVCAYEDQICDAKVKPNFTMSGEEWLLLNDFALKSGFTILFDLNALIRNDNGSWNYANAETLIEFSNSNNLNVIWELGNEPNSFRHVFNYEVNATQMAKDFHTLRRILDKYPKYKNSLLVGPDVTRPRPENTESVVYMKKFLEDAGELVDAITWHQYYFNGRTATFQDFVDPDIFNVLIAQVDTINDLVTSLGLQNKQIWLGETAAAYGGGAPGYTNRYVGTFIWLDKLGIASKLGINVVIRQSIVKGFYALIDKDYEPTPDYWISVVYKNLVGPEVIPCFVNLTETSRFYCQCASTNYMECSVVVYGMNLANTTTDMDFKNLPYLQDVDKMYAFILTSNSGTLYSKNIYLNNKMLLMNSRGYLPPLKPIVIKDSVATMPPYSTAFFVIPSKMKECSKK